MSKSSLLCKSAHCSAVYNLFFPTLLRSFLKLKSPKLVTWVSVQQSTFPPLHNNSGAGQRYGLLELYSDWVLGADQGVPLNLLLQQLFQQTFPGVPANCLCWSIELDGPIFKPRFACSILSPACAGLTVVCNGRFFIWHIPSQNRALMPRW